MSGKCNWEKYRTSSSVSSADMQPVYRRKPMMKSLREKCPNTELFLVHIFLYLNWIRVFELNTEIYSVDLRIQFKYRKIWSRKNPVFRQFSRIVKIICRMIFFVFTDPDRYIANRNSFFITNRGKCHYRSGQLLQIGGIITSSFVKLILFIAKAVKMNKIL